MRFFCSHQVGLVRMVTSFVIHDKTTPLPVKQLHYLSAFAHEYIDIPVSRIKPHGTDLPTHTINSNPHIARMLGHNDAVILIQIKHGVFDCKVRYQKRHGKVGLLRMDANLERVYDNQLTLF